MKSFRRLKEYMTRCSSISTSCFSFADFFSGTRSHVCITRAHRTCVHWRQETSLPDNFCNDKTTNVFVESTGPYTHIRSFSV